MTWLLSLYSGHNASACIGDEDGLRFAIQEERLTREKNYWGFPRLSIRACLDAVGASPRDVAVVPIGGRQHSSRYHNREDILAAYSRHSTFLGKLRQQIAIPFILRFKSDFGQDKLRSMISAEGISAPVTFYDHHTSHAATAYYGLRSDPKKRYLVLTCDGVGDNISATVRVMGRGEDRVIASTSVEDSLGTIYAWTTYAMGFLPLEHEYKLMGMAPYASTGAMAKAAKVFDAYVGLDESGLAFERRIPERTNHISERIFKDIQGQRFDHVCAGLQHFTEELLVAWTKNAVAKTGVRDVLAAGGVFMNVKANKRLAELPEVDSFEAFPSCGDETLPLGGYWLEAALRFGQENVRPLEHFYVGDDLDLRATEEAVRTSGFAHERPNDMAHAVAELLATGHPVARCAGRMEFGARALCNRSILADPSNQDVVRIINQMVKKRDFWMPFAPVMMEGRQNEYIRNPKNLRSPYMMMTFDSRENFRDLIAAVHNADLTCRAQILSPKSNPEMHSILEAFAARTGRGVLLNTSFNLHGYPIVRTAADALDVFQKSGLEHLEVGPFLVHKKP
jgi:carbamoyltransferase